MKKIRGLRKVYKAYNKATKMLRNINKEYYEANKTKISGKRREKQRLQTEIKKEKCFSQVRY